jgi:hypothetical protein
LLQGVSMSLNPPDNSAQSLRQTTWWVGRARENRKRAAAIGNIAIGSIGLISFRPFFEPDVHTRGWDWLPYVSAAISGAFILVGLFGLARSFRR